MKRTRDGGCRDDRQYVADLAAFVAEPTVHYCLASIQNDCLSNDIVFTEDGRAVTAKFSQHIQHRFKTFARTAIPCRAPCLSARSRGRRSSSRTGSSRAGPDRSSTC
jgi:hypothetical protein